MRLRLVLCASLVVLTAACSNGRLEAPPAAETPRYSGPAMPGVAANPLWAQPAEPIVAAVAVGDSFVMVTGKPDAHELDVIAATTGKTLNRIPLHEASFPSSQPTLTLDTFNGKPVAIARFDASFPASGLTGAEDQEADIVVDASGKQVWASPGGKETHFVGGYIVTGTLQTSIGLVNGNGPQIGTFSNVTSISDMNGQAVANFDPSAVQTLYTIIGTTAVVSEENDTSFFSQLSGLNLTAQGRTDWTAQGDSSTGVGDTYLGSYNNRILTAQEGTGQATVTVRDAVSGQPTGNSQGTTFDCHASIYDPDTDIVLCVSMRLAGAPLTAITLSNAQIMWQQPMTRSLSVGPAAHDLAYLQADDTTQATPSYVVINDRTGTVISANLVAAPIAITADHMALVQYAGTVFGFHLAD